MTDQLNPEDRALIERVTGRAPAPWMKDAPILSVLLDAARTEGRRSGEGVVVTDDIVREAMRDAWNEISSDTGCHPLDIERGAKGHLVFRANHWSDFTAARIRAILLRDDSTAHDAGWIAPPVEAKPADSDLIRDAHEVASGLVSCGNSPPEKAAREMADALEEGAQMILRLIRALEAKPAEGVREAVATPAEALERLDVAEGLCRWACVSMTDKERYYREVGAFWDVVGFLRKLRDEAAPPEGWVAVPREPTFKMLKAGNTNAIGYEMDLGREFVGSIYRAMLSAAPQAQPVSDTDQLPVAWRFRSPEYGGTAPRWVYSDAEPKIDPERGYTVQPLYTHPATGTDELPADWQTIDSAPTDGTEVLGYRPDQGVFTFRHAEMVEFVPKDLNGDPTEEYDDISDWYHGVWGWLAGDERPTHWAPLPAPPAAIQSAMEKEQADV